MCIVYSAGWVDGVREGEMRVEDGGHVLFAVQMCALVVTRVATRKAAQSSTWFRVMSTTPPRRNAGRGTP